MASCELQVPGCRLRACLASAWANFTQTTRHILEVPRYYPRAVKDVARRTPHLIIYLISLIIQCYFVITLLPIPVSVALVIPLP